MLSKQEVDRKVNKLKRILQGFEYAGYAAFGFACGSLLALLMYMLGLL